MRYRVLLGVVIVVALAGGFLFYSFHGGKTVTVDRSGDGTSQSTNDATGSDGSDSARLAVNPLTGQTCPDGDARPFAVMLPADTVTRPLSGISQADVVVEMPALTNGITRFMGVFRCEQPEEIGSIRSARHDFLPFAESFDAIYAHWGGSYLALDLLKTDIIDNIDALPNPFDAFWRKDDRPAPHNGFTSFARLENAATHLNYRLGPSQAPAYPHIPDNPVIDSDQNISLGYPDPYNVDFVYDHASNSYLRYRGGKTEGDAVTGKQVEVKNVVVMTAESHQVNPDYNDVDVEGEGDVLVYRNGEVVKGTWKREKETYDANSDHKYYFLDSTGQEIGFVEGKIWISIVQPNQRVELTFK